MNRNNGFTIIELMMVVLMVAIVMGIGVPGFRQLTMNNRITTSTNEFVTALNVARSEAIKRNSLVAVCKSADQQSCSDAAAWKDGWIVFNQPNATDPLEIIRVGEGLGNDINLLIAAGPFSNRVTYTATGITESSQQGTFSLCDNRGPDRGRRIEISATGRVSVIQNADASLCPSG